MTPYGPAPRVRIAADSHWWTLIETKVNVALSIALSWLLQVYVIPPVFGVQIGPAQGLGIVLSFTAVSAARQYIVRRAFIAWHRRRHA